MLSIASENFQDKIKPFHLSLVKYLNKYFAGRKGIHRPIIAS